MSSKENSSSCSKKRINAAENEGEYCHLVAETTHNVDWETEVLYDHVSIDVWKERKNVTIDKILGTVHEVGYWFLRTKLTKTTQPDAYEVAVALGVFYFSKPSVFAAFSFIALNDDGFDFFTGGTFVFTSKNSIRYRVCDDELPGNPTEVCLSPYFLFPEPLRITESISLKLRVKIFPQIVFDREYVSKLRQFQVCTPRNKFGFHASLPNVFMNDSVLGVGSLRIACHQAILCCRSPTFTDIFLPYGCRKIFKHKCLFIEINEDFDVDSIDMMMNFMYTSDVPKLTIDSANKLLKVLDRFEVRDLKNICKKYLDSETRRLSKAKYFRQLDDKIMQKLEVVANDIKSRETFTVQTAMMILNLTKNFPVKSAKSDCQEFLIKAIDESNVFEILMKADCCRASKLKRKCIEFVTTHFMDFTMNQYDILIKERPSLLKDILMEIADSQ